MSEHIEFEDLRVDQSILAFLKGIETFTLDEVLPVDKHPRQDMQVS